MKQISNQNDALKITGYGIISLSSPAFEMGGLIPVKYTCDGENGNPTLEIGPVPHRTICLALVMEDPDAPVRPWVHWLMWNIPVTRQIKENSAPGTLGLNDFGENTYGGPCPSQGRHRYYFHIYALDSLLELPSGTKRERLEKFMSEHIIGYGTLMGKYERKSQSTAFLKISKI